MKVHITSHVAPRGATWNSCEDNDMNIRSNPTSAYINLSSNDICDSYSRHITLPDQVLNNGVSGDWRLGLQEETCPVLVWKLSEFLA
jgi:hypothetical protein